MATLRLGRPSRATGSLRAGIFGLSETGFGVQPDGIGIFKTVLARATIGSGSPSYSLPSANTSPGRNSKAGSAQAFGSIAVDTSRLPPRKTSRAAGSLRTPKPGVAARHRRNPRSFEVLPAVPAPRNGHRSRPETGRSRRPGGSCRCLSATAVRRAGIPTRFRDRVRAGALSAVGSDGACGGELGITLSVKATFERAEFPYRVQLL